MIYVCNNFNVKVFANRNQTEVDQAELDRLMRDFEELDDHYHHHMANGDTDENYEGKQNTEERDQYDYGKMLLSVSEFQIQRHEKYFNQFNSFPPFK